MGGGGEAGSSDVIVARGSVHADGQVFFMISGLRGLGFGASVYLKPTTEFNDGSSWR